MAAREITESGAPPPFICISSALRRLLLQARVAVAQSQIATIEGEPGSGKRLFAQTIHHQSTLASLPFRRCDAREWLASEADTSSLAGTLYLDRVDLLAATGQNLLLNFVKVLQDSPPSRFLLLASAQTPLRRLASEGLFLPDLAFRIATVRFAMPSLRDRREDIAPLVQALLERICSRYHQPFAVLAPGTLPKLLQHPWPGNVRELASTLESAVLESRTGVIRPSDLTLQLSQTPLNSLNDPLLAPLGDHNRLLVENPPEAGNLTLNAAILRHIQYVLELNRGNKLRAARQLEISRSTLYRILSGESLASSHQLSASDSKQDE